MDYYIDILEPGPDLNEALDSLGKSVGVLYAEAWDKHKRQHYDNKPFNLNINLFTWMWFEGGLKIFVVYNSQTKEAEGFLVGAVFRPTPYQANVFQVQEWYVRGDAQMQKDLFAHVQGAVRILGCDELWIHHADDRPPVGLDSKWVHKGDFTIRRYTKG